MGGTATPHACSLGNLSTPCRPARIMCRDASFQSPHPDAGPALIPVANLAAGLLAHPAPEGMVPRRRRAGQRDALGGDVEWPRRRDPALGRSLRASSVCFSGTRLGKAGARARSGNDSPVSPANIGASGRPVRNCCRRSWPAPGIRAWNCRTRHLTHTPRPQDTQTPPQAPSQAPHAQGSGSNCGQEEFGHVVRGLYQLVDDARLHRGMPGIRNDVQVGFRPGLGQRPGRR